MKGNRRRIVTVITGDKHKMFDLLLIRDETTKKARFARKLLRIGIDKYNADRRQVMKNVKGHMDF